MADEKPDSDIPETISADGLISGDLFTGIAVSDYTDRIYDFVLDGTHAHVIQRITRLKPDRLCLGFLFLLDAPMRFRLDVLVPEQCTNARVSLQNQELIGYFSSQIPDEPDEMISPSCDQRQDKISTLRPGEFQSVNFRWESGDVLKFFFYFRDSE